MKTTTLYIIHDTMLFPYLPPPPTRFQNRQKIRSFANSRPEAQRPAAHDPRWPSSPAAPRPPRPRPTARDGPAAQRPATTQWPRGPEAP